jgi:hypothetical protein
MNEEYDVQTPATNVAENTEAQSVEENEEGIELTDTTSQEEEKKEVKNYTAEEIEKMVNDRVNDILPKKIEREKRKMEKQYSDKLAKYEETDSILKAGLGTKDISESNQRMREFYKEQGIDIPAYSKPKYSEEDEKILGKAEASKVIDLGFEEMQEEANRLAAIGVDKMTPREKVMFNTLADELTHQKQVKELAELGVKEEILNNSEFKEFASQFTSKTPIKTVYEMYTATHQPKQKAEKIGSMKNTVSKEEKDFYTPDEVKALTPEEWEKPGVWEKVMASQRKWK